MAQPAGTFGVLQMKKCVVLVSGGLDSATTLAVARSEGFEAHALSVSYGQRHSAELRAARRVAEHLGAASHKTVALDLRAIGGSALTADMTVPKKRADLETSSEIPATYVPARNLVFLSIALGYAETLEASDLFIGVTAVDYSGYPDCRPEFIRSFEATANLATAAGVRGQGFRVRAPLINLSKTRIIELGIQLGVDFSLTHSCYDPDPEGRACGACDSCLIRARAFADLQMRDPALG